MLGCLNTLDGLHQAASKGADFSRVPQIGNNRGIDHHANKIRRDMADSSVEHTVDGTKRINLKIDQQTWTIPVLR